MNKLSFIVLLIIGWFFLGTYWYVCEIGAFCGSDDTQEVERLSDTVAQRDDSGDSDDQQSETEEPIVPVSTDTDGDGLLDADEISIGTDTNLADTDGDGFSDRDEFDAGSDPLDSADTPEDDTEPEITTPQSFSDDVFFNPDSSELTGADSNQTSIDEAIAFAQDNQASQITLTGFTAAVASQVVDDDEILARSRAETVESELVAAGIAGSRITINAAGDTSASDPAQARRVTIEIE